MLLLMSKLLLLLRGSGHHYYWQRHVHSIRQMVHQSEREAVDAEDICPSFRRGVGMNGSQLMMTSDCHTHTMPTDGDQRN